MKIAITGSGGQLGSELCRQFGSAALPLTREECDLAAPETIVRRLLDLKPDLVINAAAYTQVDKAETDEPRCRAVNATAVEHLSRACGLLNAPLIQISTDYVFGNSSGRTLPYGESDLPEPRGVYAQTKFEGEQRAAALREHLIVRTCGLYGPPGRTSGTNFVDTMLRLGRAGRALRVVSDQHCTPSYVPHVSRAIVHLAHLALGRTVPWGIYHVAQQGSTTWHDFAAEIFRTARLDVSLAPITSAEYSAAAPRPSYSVLDTRKYHSLGGPAMPRWEDALREYLAEPAAGSIA